MICRLLLEQSVSAAGRSPGSAVVLTAVCEPCPEQHPALVDALQARGIPVLTRWQDLLAQPLQAVWLPLPIPLHRPYTEDALAAGLAVLCEKPAAGCIQDLDAMREARDDARLPVALGFQDIYQPSTLALKSLLAAGDIGTIRSVSITACWSRDSRYYARSTWAGRCRQDSVWVMDSPASNALAHPLNLALFLLGATPEASAAPARVEAELYRAYPIENYDTCGLRLVTEQGIPVLALFTHACRETHDTRMIIRGDQGEIIYDHGRQAEVRTARGAQTLPLTPPPHQAMIERFANLVRGAADERPVATLEVARAHLIAVNGASEAVPVRSIPPTFVDAAQNADGGTQRAIDGIEDLFQTCVREGCLPHETGRAAWTAPAGGRDLRGYAHFAGPAEAVG